MIAVVHGGVKEDNVGALFGSREFVLQGGMSIRRKLIRLCHGFPSSSKLRHDKSARGGWVARRAATADRCGRGKVFGLLNIRV
jgi:hypothetical protein